MNLTEEKILSYFPQAVPIIDSIAVHVGPPTWANGRSCDCFWWSWICGNREVELELDARTGAVLIGSWEIGEGESDPEEAGPALGLGLWEGKERYLSPVATLPLAHACAMWLLSGEDR